MRREWAEYLAPLQYIPLMASMAPLDKKTLYKAAVALSQEPSRWQLYHDYTPDCHAADTVSALLLSHICDIVYVAEGMVDALAALRMASVSYEISQVVGKPVAIPQADYINSALQFLNATSLSPEELINVVPVKRLEEPAVRLLYAMGALRLVGMALLPSPQLAFISLYSKSPPGGETT
ncbi:MAG: hypothetical protein QW680_12290 [Pyrobaculum sp.]